MNSFSAEEKKAEILAATWEYFMETGLSKASVSELCKVKKISQSSLYYWFKDKNDIWTNAGKYGVGKVARSMLDHTVNHVGDVDIYFDTLLDEADKYVEDLRMLIQITTGPTFGKQMRETLFSFNSMYEKYGEKLVRISGCTPVDAEVFIYTIIAILVDYAIWDDREKSQMLLNNLRERTVEKLGVLHQPKK